MAELRDDLRFAARLLRRSPGFTALAVLSLTLAIGANTAIFSVVNGVLLRPLPFLEPERLFRVMRHDVGRDDAPLSVPQYAYLLRQGQPFSGLAAWPVVDAGFNLSGEGPPESIVGARVTPSFFEVLGISPVLGRAFLPEEGAEGGPRVVILGYELWQQRFGAQATVLGRSITLNGEGYTVVGIAPPDLHSPRQAQLWTPLRINLATTEDAHYLVVVGRLKPEVEPERVDGLVRAQGEQLRARRPEALRSGQWLEADRLQSVRVRGVKRALLVLLGAVGLVLLIACVNMANLQLARATRREQDLSVCSALGATPRRIARQMLTESVLLSCAGGALGLGLAAWTLPTLLALAPEDLPRPDELRIDGVVLLYTLGVSLAAGVFFGLLPAWSASRMDSRGLLRVNAMRVTPTTPRGRAQWVLVVGQVALAVILLVAAALLGKSFVLLRSVAPGFDSQDVRTVKLSLPESHYGSPEALESFTQQVQARLKGLPGVESVGFTLTLPLEPGLRLEFIVPERKEGPGSVEEMGNALYRPVTRGYFEALKIELVRGRLLDDLDRSGGPPVAVINEAAARRYWPGEEPLGKQLLMGSAIPEIADPTPREIIGVVRDVRELSLDQAAPPIVYVPLGQMPMGLLSRFVRTLPQNLVVRTSGQTHHFSEAVRKEIWTVDEMQPVADLGRMDQVIAHSLEQRRFNTLLLGLMAGMALVLAVVGLYGALSYRVSQRTRELGVRLALGASRGALVWLVLRRGLFAVSAGVSLGLAAAFVLAQLLDRQLYAVSAWDPAAFMGAPAVMIVAALVSTVLPAFRAARVDPMVTLMAE
ncbi:ABC transporter permease [Hyalangium versicolor]|uniref:ABC transporter permease n=1 Tax=Hyalangium versicolor TaxID=2861190 RepID=UPI001CCC6016|nr:ABC transporter permease [Hyalangium versicolor]